MFQLTKLLFILTFIFSFGVVFSYSQEGVIVAPRSEVISTVSSRPVNSEDEKGSTVRGRVVYRDTGRPVRHGWVGFSKIRELVAPPEDENSAKAVLTVASSRSDADKYTLTDGNGEFVLKNIKAGIYQAIVKVPGVLNPDYSDRENPEFQPFAIDGVSEIQTEIGVRRGAAISGRVLYPDGEPIIDAKVQVFAKDKPLIERYSYGSDRDNIMVASTDDRGFYRFTGLPAGEYIVRVTEKVTHASESAEVSSYSVTSYNNNSQLKTFYPSGSNVKEAAAVQAYLGQEQTGIDISIPDRQLFRISGTVVAKNSKKPLENVTVSFSKIEEPEVVRYYQGEGIKADAQGKWLFKELPKGKYRLTFAQKIPYSYDESKPKQDNQPKYASVSREVEIDSENLADINVELPIQATISGIITVEDNQPFPDFVSFMASDAERMTGSSSYINKNDNQNAKLKNSSSREFKLSGLSEGKFRLSARTEDYYVKSIRLGSRDLLASPLEVKDGDAIEGVQIVLGADVGTLKGTVSNFIKGKIAFVVLLPSGKTATESLQNSRSALISQSGNFEIKAAPGEYIVIIGTEDNRPESENIEEWFTELIKDAQSVTIRSNETATMNLSFPN